MADDQFVTDEASGSRRSRHTLESGAPALASGPLAGLRAVVLTQAWAGTFAMELLGFLGAEVIQIEARQRLDSWRGGYGGQIPPALRGVATAVHPWNCSPLYNAVNLGKQAMTLDLSRPEGIDLFRRLVPVADIVAENFTPRVLGNLGLAYADLKAIRPELILLSMSAYGASGPYRNIPGIGGTIEPMSGMSALLGYEDGPPINSGQMYPDPVAGYFGTAAVLLAVHHRERTGEGQHIDLSMQETNMTFIADALLEYSALGRVRPRLGNHHPSIAPHGVYRCAGDDRWIALSAATDAEFERLARAAGHAEWIDDARFSDLVSRKRNEAALDAAIGAWTRTRDAAALESELLQAGVTAARVHDAEDVMQSEHLRERGMIVEIDHPETGRHPQAAAPWRLSGMAPLAPRPAPGLGEHSREVLQRFLCLGDDEYARLEALGITGTGPPD